MEVTKPNAVSTPEYDYAGYKKVPIQLTFAMALRSTGMNAEQLAEDLRIQGIMDTDPSNVRRWIRHEASPPKLVWDRVEVIRRFVLREFDLNELGAIGIPPAAQQFRLALWITTLRALHPRRIERDAADPAMCIKVRRKRRKA